MLPHVWWVANTVLSGLNCTQYKREERLILIIIFIRFNNHYNTLAIIFVCMFSL